VLLGETIRYAIEDVEEEKKPVEKR